ncbi:MAG: TonB family protein [Acidiferrobacterales bacterium]
MQFYMPPTQTRASSAGRTARSSPETSDMRTPKTTKRSVESVSSTAGSTDTSETARAPIRGRLQTDLSRYFWYPAVARRLGWQGSVRVRFTIEPDGRLTNIRVAQGSGYAVLDESAIQALRKVRHLAEAPAWLEGRAIDIELPVIYRLEEH